MAFKPKDKSEIESIVKSAITDAVAFVESEVSPDRLKAQQYYDGHVTLTHEEGRSKVVATKVRDTIRATKPSLMRVFLSTSRPVEFVPTGKEDVMIAEQATTFMHHEFTRLNGFNLLNDVFHDALLKKQGIAKAYWVDEPTAEIHSFSDLSDDEYTFLVAEDDITVLEHSMEISAELDGMGLEIEASTHSVKISRESDKGEIRIESVPPEEFFVDISARTLKDAYIVAHRTEMRAGDVVAMGFDAEVIEGLSGFDSGSEISNAEVIERTGFASEVSDEDELDPSMKNVAITEAYMRIDIDGTGVPILHKFICGGTNYDLLDYEPCDEVPFAVFEVDPEPHAFYGHSLAEIIMEDQDAGTSILRGILDNVAMVNNPRLGIVENHVDFEDVMNNEIGAVIRMKSPEAIVPIVVPFTAGQTLSALSYLDGVVEAKTGVTRASMGLAPDTLQSNTRLEAQATIQGAAGQVEVMVRNLAVGVKDLFGIMLRLTIKNFDEEKMQALSGNAAQVDPRVWNSSMDVSINVGLGTGREEEKMSGLNQALQMQTMIYQTYGPQNGLVSLTNIRNTLSDMLATSGIRNSDRYFAPITQEIEQQMMQQQQAAQGQAQEEEER